MVVAAGFAGAVVRKQNQIVARFRAAGATAADRASAASTLRVEEGAAFRILRRHAILREEGAGYYLDESRWEAHAKRRRRLALLIPLAFVLVALVVSWFVRR